MLPGAVVLWALLACTDACAQVSGSVTLVSDYRFRGVSLSDGQPALQLSLAWERDEGWYAGVFGSNTRLYGRAGTQLLSYIGYVRRLRNGLSWEAGAEYAAFSSHPGDAYPELYLGLASDRLSGRLYYARGYFGEGGAVLYAELNGAHALNERVRLLGHVGWLQRTDDVDAGHGAERRRLDARAGVGVTFGKFDWQLVRVTSEGGGGAYPVYPVGPDATGDAWVLSVSRGW